LKANTQRGGGSLQLRGGEKLSFRGPTRAHRKKRCRTKRKSCEPLEKGRVSGGEKKYFAFDLGTRDGSAEPDWGHGLPVEKRKDHSKKEN